MIKDKPHIDDDNIIYHIVQFDKRIITIIKTNDFSQIESYKKQDQTVKNTNLI